MSNPEYWMQEKSGVLRPVIEKYLAGGTLTAAEITVMRGYLALWIIAPGFSGPDIDLLRRSVGLLTTQQQINDWIDAADRAGAQPL